MQTDDDETEHPAEAEATEEVGGDAAVAGQINAETEAVNFCFNQCCSGETLTQANRLNEEARV
jgi:hypothetical protein